MVRQTSVCSIDCRVALPVCVPVVGLMRLAARPGLGPAGCQGPD